jgi:preprotein translocase subunit SecE
MTDVAPKAGSSGSSNRFFEIYKRSQGYYTRMGTTLGAGVLVLAGADWLYSALEGIAPSVDFNQGAALYVRVLVAVGIPGLFALLTYWLVGVNRKACDFLIATEGEMKKVSWSTKNELWGSTKVVIFFTLLMALLLFIVDLFFLFVFSAIGVLKGGGMLDSLKALLGFES